jgi:uncharacterized LabA/DUF88 family protein
MGNRSIIYIDGFNLYYGCVRGTRHKWLNLQTMFERLRPHDDIQIIHYFTALVQGPRRKQQETYLSALATTPKVNIILGKFKPKRIICNIADCTYPGKRIIASQEEKRTDVNIAIQMLDDAYGELADRIIIVSGDSDLVPAVHLVKERFPKIQITVYVPARDSMRGAAVELRNACDNHRTLPMNLIKRSQFPPTIEVPGGEDICKPKGW